ncbi:MAG: hypothetical protein D3917_10330, partial [Candidatus Electrothrix sp. AX5]|nr:hypothetical protein [Candidatus Electrothrix sp. AX5]
MPRMFFLASMTLSLALSGCGPKEIEPYQTATEAASRSKMATATTYPLSYGSLQDKQGSIDEENIQGSIDEENMSAESIASLAEDLPMPEEDK